jgi:hypothetical protein
LGSRPKLMLRSGSLKINRAVTALRCADGNQAPPAPS